MVIFNVLLVVTIYDEITFRDGRCLGLLAKLDPHHVAGEHPGVPAEAEAQAGAARCLPSGSVI